jgi:hypothetical protein
MSTLVFVHGRRQEGKDPRRLRRAWAAALNNGLTIAGHRVVTPDAIVFPFYGDLLSAKKLQAISSGADLDLEDAGALREQNIDPLMPEPVQRLESDLLRSMVRQAGIADIEAEGVADIDPEGLEEAILKIPGARKILKRLSDRTHADQEFIEGFLSDVAVYLEVARDDVLGLVRPELEAAGGDLVLVAHSLGTVVVRDLLDDAALRDRTSLLVTVGSPLGLQAVYRNLLTPGPAHPKVEWITAWDPDDFVALGHPLTELYGEPLTDIRVDNPFGKAHAVEQYLAHESVADRIGQALDR